MGIEEYIIELLRLKTLAVDRWGNLDIVERQILDESFQWLVENLNIKKGDIEVDEDLPRSMDNFVQAVQNIINTNRAYQSKLNNFLGDLGTIRKNTALFHQTTNNFDINTAGVNDVQKAVVEEIVNQYLGNGLNQHFAAPLRDNIFRNMLTGANMKQVKEVLRSYIISGEDKSGKLQQYLGQTAQQAVDTYTGAINQKLVEQFTFTGYIISGSLIATSSDQCVEAVETSRNGYLNFKEWEKILEIARENTRAKLIDGTTIKTLPINKLHWGCRHDFTPVIMGEPKKEEAKQVKKEQTPVPVPEIGTIGKAGSLDQARQQVSHIFQANLGIKVNRGTKISKDMTLERLNKYLEVVDKLTSEYNLSTAWNNERGVGVNFESTSRYYGQVSYNYKSISLINFGHRTDTDRAFDVNPKLDYLRSKSRVDKENLELATVVHEFAHVISIRQQQPDMPGTFWLEMKRIKKEYVTERNSLIKTNIKLEDKNSNDAPLAEIHLGQYANTNLSEFMAEGFTEYKLLKNPSKYAKKIGLLIDKYFKRK